jgi:hypothetical protein
MKQLHDTVWQRRGVSWIWENDAFSEVTKAAEVFSLREVIRASKSWPDCRTSTTLSARDNHLGRFSGR